MRTPPYPLSLPPWCDANTQPGEQGIENETAITESHIGSKALPVQTQIVTTGTEVSGPLPFLAPPPRGP